MITLLLLVRATYIWVLFFTHIPFVLNHTFNATPAERLQQRVKIQVVLVRPERKPRWVSSN